MGVTLYGRFLAVAATVAMIIGPLGTTVASPADAAVSTATASHQICVSNLHPRMAKRLSERIEGALSGRLSVVGLDANDARLDLTCQLNVGTHFNAASVIKATIISALLLKKGGPKRLTTDERALAWRMITESDNDAATALWDDVTIPGMQRFLNKAKMTHTVLSDAWGLTQITAHDELLLLRLLSHKNKVLNANSRRYVLYLMAHVISSQRWGVPFAASKKVTVHVKNGWLPTGSGWDINSIGVFTGKNIIYQIAMLTDGNPSMPYGIDTIQGVCKYINLNIDAF
jgi:Beta-lactamase enzyme family